MRGNLITNWESHCFFHPLQRSLCKWYEATWIISDQHGPSWITYRTINRLRALSKAPLTLPWNTEPPGEKNNELLRWGQHPILTRVAVAGTCEIRWRWRQFRLNLALICASECVPGINLCFRSGTARATGECTAGRIVRGIVGCHGKRIENSDNCRETGSERRGEGGGGGGVHARNTEIQRHARLHTFELNANVNAP